MSEASTAKKVTIYATTWCAFCKTEKQYLERLSVDFDYKDIEANPEDNDELLAKIGGNFQGVPVTDIDGEIVLGFDRAKIDGILKEKGLVKTA